MSLTPELFAEWGAQLRPMQAQDIEPVLTMERRNFHMPWTRRAFLTEIMSTQVSQPLVIVYQNEIIGYVVPWFVADEVQIANLAIREDFRRRGLARHLIMHLCELAQNRRCSIVHLEVRRSNTAARQLYESLEFQMTGVRRDYYGPGEDALLMSKKLNLDAAALAEASALS